MGKSMELVLVPWPVMGHVQIVEFANLLIHHQLPLSQGANVFVTVLVMKLPDYIDTVSSSYTDLLCSSSTNKTPGVNFHKLPTVDPAPDWGSKTRGYFIHNLIKSQKPNIADYLHSRKTHITGLVVDMLCTSMIGVAAEFNIPSYVFFTSPASFLGAILHCQTLHDEKNQDVPALRNSVSEIFIPSFYNTVPPNIISLVLVDKQQWLDRFLHYARDYRKARGIIINTFVELESYALNSLSQDSVPPIYTVGPILNHGPHLEGSHGNSSEIVKWLDEQPTSSVVFVCFGSQGSLPKEQVRELACGLENSGFRFLWSLRRQSELARFPCEYDNYGEVLPDGFLGRTAGIGRVVGWVPQLEVLSHPAVGGFVSHCGWNSVLESIWCGVPIATWPLHAEQQMNAFQLVRELGLAVEITLSYHERGEGDGAKVTAGKIERQVRVLMESGSAVREKVREMREASRVSVVEGGSSHLSLDRLIKCLMNNATITE